MANSTISNIILDDCKIFWKNLSGAPDKFNKTGGQRTFCVIIPNDIAPELEAEGWAIKYLRPRDEEEEPQAYLKVKASYGPKSQPNIYICTKKKKELLNQDTVGSVDYAEINRVDLIIRPYEYKDINGHSGVSAYVKNMYITINEDPFADRYSYDEEF